METDKMFSQSFWRKNFPLLAILALSLMLNVTLGWKVRALSNYIESKSRKSKVLEGIIVSEITALGLNGESKLLVWSDTEQSTILYFFSPTCVWCDRNLNNIKALKSSISQSHRLIGISLSASRLNEYVKSHQLDFPIYQQPSKEVIQQLNLGITPQTIVISPQGKVLKNWEGAFSSTRKIDIEAYFGIQLPGIIE